jgi:hypothetical protein
MSIREVVSNKTCAMKNRMKKLNKHAFIAQTKIEKIIRLIAGPMAEVARGGSNNKMNVMGPAEGLVRNYDNAVKIFRQIPEKSFENDPVSITEIKRITGSVQSYRLKKAIEDIFTEDDPNKKQGKISSVEKHMEMMGEMISIMKKEKLKLTA